MIRDLPSLHGKRFANLSGATLILVQFLKLERRLFTQKQLIIQNEELFFGPKWKDFALRGNEEPCYEKEFRQAVV